MELDELKSEWLRRDRALTAALNNHARLLKGNVIDNQRRALRRAGQMRGLSLAVWILCLAIFGRFLGTHWGDWKFFLPALALDVWTLATGAIAVYQQQALRALDFSLPTLALQQRLAALRQQRLRAFQWAFLTGQLVWWVPFVIVLFKGLLDVNLYAASAFMPEFLAINLAFSLAIIPLGLWLSRWLGPKLAGTRFAGAFLDAIAGRDLQEARRLAERLAAFGRDDG